MQRNTALALALSNALACGLSLLASQGALAGEPDGFIPRLVNSSTVPATGDLNPYGVAFVPEGFPAGGSIAAGDVLVSNFNNSNNVQGTGRSIIRLRPTGQIAPPPASPPAGTAVTFFSSQLPGLSTALGVLSGGLVIVGNVPTEDGTFGNIRQGALQVIDRNGKLVQTLTDPLFLEDPWDLALDDDGTSAHIFVSNVKNGTVSRLDVTVAAKLTVHEKTLVAKGYSVEPNLGAVILGPTGLAFDEASDTLYVASTGDNAIYSVPNATRRTGAVTRGALVFADAHLRGPLALKFAPNGHLLTANGDAKNADPLHPSEIVEFTRSGEFVRQYNVDAAQGGAFGLDTVRDRDGDHDRSFNYAAVDDVTNSLSVYRLPSE